MSKRNILLAVVLILSVLLASCQAPPAEPQVVEVTRVVEVEGETVIEYVEVEEEAKIYDGQSINFLTIQPHTVSSKALASWFEEETGARVNVLVVPYGNVTEKAVLDVAAGSGEYDVIDYWYPMLGTMVENGVLLDISDWWDENYDELGFDDFLPTYEDLFTEIDGKRYGIPYDGDLHVLYYNKTILAEYGFEPPTTWDEYLEICQTITEAGAADGVYGCGIMGAKVPLILIGSFLNRLGGYGGAFFDETGYPTVNSPEAVLALEALITQSEYALPEPPAVAFDELLGGWLTGNVAMAEFWTDLGQMTDNPEQSTIPGEWGVVAMPQGTGDNANKVAPINAGFGMGVSNLAQNQEVALAFLEFASRPDIVVKANTLVGGLDPTRTSTLDDPAYRDHVSPELADAIKEAHNFAVGWPTNANWAELQEVLNENLSLALIGDKTAQEALDDTQAQWLTILGLE
ncbi:MAG: sugar ABC transporter substrate-binding protein [Chloroflexi bacterium]|nr:sugar ABC transporter substrate-binding protein [Chloroflexota bacterium]